VMRRLGGLRGSRGSTRRWKLAFSVFPDYHTAAISRYPDDLEDACRCTRAPC
jgi:hypothetical protein